MSVIILGIESSCDDTSAAVCIDGKVVSNVTANQDIHKSYGGVVPELASRAHQENIVPVVTAALQKAGVKKEDLSAIGFTLGPGLLGSLLVGCSFSKALALSLEIPLIGVNHMKAHVLAHFIDEPQPAFPFLCLTVSGGHTQLVLVRDYLDMEIIGDTIDDAAGEAFDKTAKMLGFPYPGGPLIDKHAKQGDPLSYKFAQPQVKEFDFSFSGFKTSVLYGLRKLEEQEADFIENHRADLCASIQYTIVQVLIKKLKKAAIRTDIRSIAIAGGVSANSGLRTAIEELGKKHHWSVFIPDFQYCTDNAGMIAYTAYQQYLAKDFVDQQTNPQARIEWGKATK